MPFFGTSQNGTTIPKMSKKALIACEYSGTVRDAFLRKGIHAVSCDLLPSDSPDGEHYQGDVMDILYDGWDIMIGFPPCTFLSNSGVRWLYNKDGSVNKERFDNMRRGAIFFKTLLYAPIKKIAIENPVQHGHCGIEGYTQTVQPYEFGHTTSKRTCLWLQGLPKLIPTNIIPKEQRTQDIWLASPGPDRWKIRSKTFKGIADAMADQWSKLL